MKALSLLSWLAFAPLLVGAPSPRPNLVFILTDNHGAWTLGCYGNPEIRTPNIDKLAAEGLRFNRAYCNNSVCSPSRASFLTGLMPSQHGVHVYIPNAAQIGDKAYCTIREFRTLPKILSEAGYVCGLSGKWHLGDNLRGCHHRRGRRHRARHGYLEATRSGHQHIGGVRRGSRVERRTQWVLGHGGSFAPAQYL